MMIGTRCMRAGCGAPAGYVVRFDFRDRITGEPLNSITTVAFCGAHVTEIVAFPTLVATADWQRMIANACRPLNLVPDFSDITASPVSFNTPEFRAYWNDVILSHVPPAGSA